MLMLMRLVFFEFLRVLALALLDRQRVFLDLLLFLGMVSMFFLRGWYQVLLHFLPDLDREGRTSLSECFILWTFWSYS
jgi:hypothetical protein